MEDRSVSTSFCNSTFQVNKSNLKKKNSPNKNLSRSSSLVVLAKFTHTFFFSLLLTKAPNSSFYLTGFPSQSQLQTSPLPHPLMVGSQPPKSLSQALTSPQNSRAVWVCPAGCMAFPLGCLMRPASAGSPPPLSCNPVLPHPRAHLYLPLLRRQLQIFSLM